MIKIAFLPYNNNGQQVDLTQAEAATYTDRSSGSPRLEHKVALRRSWAHFSQLSPTIDRYLALFDAQKNMIWRSGKRTLSRSSDMYILLKEQVEISASEMSGMLPPLPIKQDEATIKTMKIELKKGKVAVSGSGTYDGWVDVDYTFTYSFKLNPYHDLRNTKRIVAVSTVDGVDVSGTGFFGFLVSFIANFMEEGFTKQVEQTLQKEIDKAVDKEVNKLVKENLDGERPDGITVTVQSVTITSDKVTVDVVAGVPASAINCGGQLSSKKVAESPQVGLRSLTEVNEIRSLRDAILEPSEQGQRYRKLYEQHQEEIFEILVSQPEILMQGDEAVMGILRDFRDGDGQLSEDTATAVQGLLGKVKDFASPELSEAIDTVEAEVPQFIGKTPKDVL